MEHSEGLSPSPLTTLDDYGTPQHFCDEILNDVSAMRILILKILAQNLKAWAQAFASTQ